jgi:hypothetical protein
MAYKIATRRITGGRGPAHVLLLGLPVLHFHSAWRIGYDGAMEGSNTHKAAAILVIVGLVLIALVILPRQPGLLQVIICWFAGWILIGAGISIYFNRPVISVAAFLIAFFSFIWLASQMGHAPRIGPDGKPIRPPMDSQNQTNPPPAPGI